jgi:hypothetical protein
MKGSVSEAGLSGAERSRWGTNRTPTAGTGLISGSTMVDWVPAVRGCRSDGRSRVRLPLSGTFSMFVLRAQTTVISVAVEARTSVSRAAPYPAAEVLSLLLWHQESFAYADRFDEAAARYVGLRCGQAVALSADNVSGLLVKPDIARRQQEAETKPTPPPGPDDGQKPIGGTRPLPPTPATLSVRKRFHGAISLDPARVGRDAGRVADEVIAHLVGLMGAKVKVTLEIEAEVPGGVPDNVVRVVTENSRTLKFTSQEFEAE